MAIRRIATAKPGKGKPAVTIEINGNTTELEHAELIAYDTPAKILIEMERRTGIELSGVFFHVNRDNSIAMATGKPPSPWPEDAPKE